MIGYKATDKDGCCRGFKFEVEGTFLAGLKAGRPKWHDLREEME